jgi:3-hydroxybutyryl-CoA dehydrogenase
MDIRRVTVVGAGTMGHGIGQEFARAGFEVVLYGRSPERLAQAKGNIERNLREMAAWELLPAETIPAILGRVRLSTDLRDAAGDADLVIEAVPEYLDMKLDVFRALDAICPSRTILASNTSSIMPSMLAPATKRPDRMLVVHFFYPPHLMPLVELVKGQETSQATLDAAYTAVKAAGKTPVIVQKEALGFIANRMQAALQREALYIVEQGIASAQDVDLAVKQSFGRRLGAAGPLEMVEVQDGWDITWQIHGFILPDIDGSKTPSPVIKQKMEANELGPKTGQGFYAWTPERVEAWRQNLVAALARWIKADQQAGKG